MDVLTVAGVLLSMAAIIGGNILEGGHTGSLIQLTAFVIVMGGTVGAIMVQTPMNVFMRSLKLAKWILIPPKLDPQAQIEKIVSWSETARKDGLLGLEGMVEGETDSFEKKGLQLLVDGSEPEVIRNILEVELDAQESFDNQAANVYEGMGGYCPTIGIIGAVMGLIHVMENLADPSKLGAGIAVAFVATIYGVGLANLFFLPMANKIKAVVSNRAQVNQMTIEGIVSISSGDNPRNIEMKLQSFVV